MEEIKQTLTDNLPNSSGVTSGNLNNIVAWVLGAAGIIAVAVIIYGAIKYLTAQGQPDKIKQASQIVAFAIIGLVIVSLAVVITNFVLGLIGSSTGGAE